ncbi:MAG: NADH-quinone oxidoreductase subunit NuoH [Prevotella shahii]|jgi:NADH dehydrogenase (ubiquinone), H subunit|uniref:NADH-quinone oxidoreductase subunit H n=1 Tax=Hoylesella shahii DSM 15611 = JCM 12083 TaxID=1122991 RepID=A0A318HVT1_9BACT|nr:NADH-quinone oxidoreductase subunit NuoH [Hoylesella shahii]MBF1568637.1 NADH-quinone oxidoreductase subunit NuoH [Hoylesella shahii]MBF1590925.1 NADH-quinone oxidoreductase subunit NuoH [Hoylesella shahii]PXX20191.1 NADH:ubiquinone oxidoreductase subunit H [Hoylesella shahii DSM 15611 = JCM 12083]
MFDFSIVTTWFDSLLRDTCGLSSFWAILIECVLVGVFILAAYAILAILLIFMERKVCAAFQCRLGPMRVGPWGIFQVIADVLKMLIKEIFAVDKADKLLYAIAPILVLVGSVGAFSFMPWNNGATILDFNVGIFLMTAISSIGVIGIFIAGWSSNNKYSVISAMRGAVQMISYEMSLGLCLITAVILTGTMQVSGIVEAQSGPFGWLIFQGHIPAIIAFLVFLVTGNAEANRGPFDLAEAESELTAGYHTEYSGMGFGFFYLAEYLNLFIVAGVASMVFLGGWMPIHIGVEGFDKVMDYIPGIVWFIGKAFALVWVLMWIRWTFPRLRIDQILKLEWKYLMPLSLLNLVLMTIIVAFGWYIK